jgi:hypothetical protein
LTIPLPEVYVILLRHFSKFLAFQATTKWSLPPNIPIKSMVRWKIPLYHNPMTFEDFLRDAERRPESDPGTAMVETLRRNHVDGINIDRILLRVDPRNRPENVLGFLSEIARAGSWKVNLNIRIS